MRKKILAFLLAVLLAFAGGQAVLAEHETADTTVHTEELVIVLDPGHDATHAGAGGNGLREEKLVLKIGHYLRDELNQYQNVKVYMTRESEGCPFPETCGISEGSKRCNEKRVAFAESVGADVYIALHLNSHTSSSAKGALAFVPNNNYDPEAGATGQQLGKTIVGKLGELGLKVEGNGTRIVNSQSDTAPSEYYYPDGSIADYYRVIRYAKKAFIPAIIVEHAFLSNAGDVANYLSTEEQLKALALKDAQGIVEYYGLSLKDGSEAGTVPDITVTPVSDPDPKPETTPEPVPEAGSEGETETTVEVKIEDTTETEKDFETKTETVDVTETEETIIPEETVEEYSDEEHTFPWAAVMVMVAVFAAALALMLVFYTIFVRA